MTPISHPGPHTLAKAAGRFAPCPRCAILRPASVEIRDRQPVKVVTACPGCREGCGVVTDQDEAPTTALESETGERCGWSYDHDAEVAFEDDYVRQWVCRRCGAEGEDLLAGEPTS